MKSILKTFLPILAGVLTLAAGAAPAGVKTIRTLQVDVFPMTELPGRYSCRLLSKGYDSAPKSWGLEASRAYFGKKAVISLRRKGFKFFSVEKELTPFALTRITICFDKGKAVMYINGVKAGETDAPPIEDNSYSLKVGSYMNGAFALPGKVTGVKLLDKAVIPQKLVSKERVQHYLTYRPSKSNTAVPFKVLRGKWRRDMWGFSEFSDNTNINALAVSQKIMPESFVFTACIATGDSAGKTILEFCRQDEKNGYKLVLQNGSPAHVLYLYKKEKGVETLLEKVSSETVKLPVRGNRNYPMTLSVGRHQGMIHVRADGAEVLSVYDDTFKKGAVGIGAHERKVQFREVTVTGYSHYTVEKRPKPSAKHELTLSSPSLRRVFFSDEKIVLTACAVNRTAAPFSPGTLLFKDGKRVQKLTCGKVGAMKTFCRQLTIDGKALGDGKKVFTLSNGKLRTSLEITLIPRPQEQGYAYYNWGGGKLADMIKNSFNGVTVTISPKDDIRYLRSVIAAQSDYAMKNNMRLGVHIPLISQVPAGGKQMVLVRKDGSSSGRLNSRSPAARAYIRTRVAAIAKLIKDYPAVNRVLLDSEAENFIELGYSKEDIARAEKELGFAPPMAETSDVELDGTQGRRVSLPEKIKKEAPAVFPVNDKNYRFMLWFWERGAGDNLLRAEAADIIRKEAPHLLIHHDPYRDVPLSSRMLNMDLPGTWFYCHPDAGETFMAVESQLSACRGGGKPERFILDPSLFLYSQRIGPARSYWAGVQPVNIHLTALHLGFAARPEMIEVFNLNYLMPDSKPQFRQKDFLPQVRGFIRDFVRPLWSVTRHLKREQPKTALMLSFGTQVFNRSFWGGYGNAPANTILNLFWKANIPTAVITEETIRQGELARYDQLLLFRTTHLPADVFEKIKDYAARGGKVIVEPGSPWEKLLPAAVRYALPTDKITRSYYYQIKSGKGFTADAVYGEQQRLARDLRRFRTPQSTFADTGSRELYIRTLAGEGCYYVFLVNDKRTFGDYFGKKYKAVYDAGLPLKADVTLKTAGAVYEYPAQKRHEVKNGRLSLNFKPTEGKVLIVYPEAVASLNVKKTGANRFEIAVLGRRKKAVRGIQPLRLLVTLAGGRKEERFYPARNGLAVIRDLPAAVQKIEAKELGSGISARWSR